MYQVRDERRNGVRRGRAAEAQARRGVLGIQRSSDGAGGRAVHIRQSDVSLGLVALEEEEGRT